MVIRDKLIGGFMGMCLGDALGAAHERRKNEYTGVLDKPTTAAGRFQSPKYSAIGQVTDDASMSIALLQCIYDNNGYDEDNVIFAYLKWANSNMPFLGKNTRNLFKGIKTMNGYISRYKKFSSVDIESNGSLMRAYPLILLSLWDQDIYKYGLDDTILTNPSPINQDGVLIYLAAGRLILKNIYTPQEIVTTCHGLCQTDEIKKAIGDAINGEKRNIIKNKGWICHAIYISFYVLFRIDNFKEGIDYIINQGGDTDTNACIGGGLLGLVYGYDNMIMNNITAKNVDIMLKSDSLTGEIHMDIMYHPKSGLHLLEIILDKFSDKLIDVYQTS